MPGTLKDGIYYPSVTEIISSVLTKGPKFEAWLGAVGNAKAADIKNKKAAIGTKIHKEIQSALEGCKCSRKCRKFVDFMLATHGNDYISEKQFFSDKGFCGTPDLIFTPSGLLIDFKTGAIRKQHEAQMSGYINLLNDNGIEIKKCEIWHLSPDYTVSVLPVCPPLTLFLNILEIYKWMNRDV